MSRLEWKEHFRDGDCTNSEDLVIRHGAVNCHNVKK